MSKSNAMEKLLWSIALPGFGQILNGKYFKGLLFIALEFIINVKSHFNTIIISSFHGDITEAIEQADFQWLMFYPCIYMFALWDAYRDAGGGKDSFAFIPFVIAAYLTTIGLIYSSKFRITGVLLGPVWLPILFCCIGIGVGLVIKRLLTRWLIYIEVNEK